MSVCCISTSLLCEKERERKRESENFHACISHVLARVLCPSVWVGPSFSGRCENPAVGLLLVPSGLEVGLVVHKVV